MISASKDDSASFPSEIEYGHASVVNMADSTFDPSVLTFFVVSTKLYHLAQQILLSFYSDENLGKTLGYDQYFEGEASVFRFERLLQGWCDDLPKYLDLCSEVSSGSSQDDLQMTFHRQAVVLRLRCVCIPVISASRTLTYPIRFLQVRIYLFRPVFARLCISQPAEPSAQPYGRPCGDDLNYRVALQCCILCVKTAREIIEITYNNLTTTRSWGRKPAWLYGTMRMSL
jgi:hypothetical protein